jgi:plasmid stabilization system protein ParE
VNLPFHFTPQAAEDLDAIWWFIADDNRDAADRVEIVIVYRPETAPLEIIAILHGRRDLTAALEGPP